MTLSNFDSTQDPLPSEDGGVELGWTVLPPASDNPEDSIVATMVKVTGSRGEFDTHTTGDLRQLGFRGTGESENYAISDRNASPSDAYTIYALVALGGCGEVWMARQNSLQRIVALKAVRGSIQGHNVSQIADQTAMERAFRIEAMATAQLEHPNIVPVYDYGSDDRGMPVMAMKLVRGEPWNEVLARDLEVMPQEEYLQKHLGILQSMMQAVAFAHSRGVVHRDLKPSQVMLGQFGEVLLMDWGLAISIADEAPDVSPTGESVKLQVEGMPNRQTAASPCGTPCYMAPEQTLNRALEVTVATDVYLIGGILYQILTGKPPRRGARVQDTIEMAARGEVTPPQQIAPDRELPQELVRLTLKALSPRPADRHGSVHELLEDVRLFLSGSSNRVQAETMVFKVRDRFENLQAKMESPDGVGAAALYGECSECLSDLGRAAGYWPRLPAIRPLRKSVLDVYSTTALNEGDLMLARGLASLMEPGSDRAQLLQSISRKEHQVAQQRYQRKLMIAGLIILLALHGLGTWTYLQSQKRAQERLAVERDAANLARAAADKARVEAAELQDRAERDQYFSSITAADISLERLRGESAVSLLLNGTKPSLRQWEWGVLMRRVLGDRFAVAPLNFVGSAAWSPDSARIYSGSRDGALHIWDGRSGRYLDVWRYFAGRLYEVDPSPDGQRLLLTSFDKYAVIAAASNGQPIHRLMGHEGLLKSGAWSPDGQLVATTSFDKTAIVWNAITGKSIRSFAEFQAIVNTVEFSRDGQRLLLSSDDGSAVLLDIQTGHRVGDYSNLGFAIYDAKFSPDGARVATACQDGVVRVFNTSNDALIRQFRLPESAPHTVCFVRGDDLVATVLENGDGYILQVSTGEIVTRFLGEGLPRDLQVSPDGQFLTVAGRFVIRSLWLDHLLPSVETLNPARWKFSSQQPDVRLTAYGLTPGRDPVWNQMERPWNVPGGYTIKRQSDRTIMVESRYQIHSPDGRYRFVMDPDTLFGRVVDVASGRTVFELVRNRLTFGRFSPDGRWFIAVDPLDKVHLVSTSDWKVRKVLSGESTFGKPGLVGLDRYIIGEVDFSPDSERLAVAFLNGHMVVWELAGIKPLFQTQKLIGVGPSVRFDPSGKLLVTGGNDDRIAIWNARTGQLERTIKGHNRPIMDSAFSPDGSRLVTFARDRTVRLWDPVAGRELMTLLKVPDGKMPVGAQFTRDGKALVIVVNDGAIQLQESLPWDESYYALPQEDSGSSLSLAQRIELHTRRSLLGPHVTAMDLVHMPKGPTAVYTSGTVALARNR